MKSKILHSIFLATSLATIFLTMKSDINGKYNGGTSCGTCHGNQNAATTVNLTGIPATGFVVGTTYNLTATISNSSLSKAGFNIACTAGSFTAGTGSKVNTSKNQITHTAPTTAVSGVSTFQFTWTAPSTLTNVTFNMVGNAVNGNGQDDSGDQWNTKSFTYTANYPASISNNTAKNIVAYPNPVINTLFVNDVNNVVAVKIVDVLGKNYTAKYANVQNKLSVDCSSLAKGDYFLRFTDNTGKLYQQRFVKN